MSGLPGPRAEIARGIWAFGADLWGFRHRSLMWLQYVWCNMRFGGMIMQALRVKAYPLAELSVLIFEDRGRHCRR